MTDCLNNEADSVSRQGRSVWIALLTSAVLAAFMACGHLDPSHAAEPPAKGVPAAKRPSVVDMGGDPDCPTLPACPSGPQVPLPPNPEGNSNSTTSSPFHDGVSLVVGRGKHRDMVRVPGGPFEIGSRKGHGRADERPRKKVYLESYYISKHEVTTEQYCAFLNAKGNITKDGFPRINLNCPDCPVTLDGKAFKPREGLDDRPVVCVSWYGAQDYAKWAGGRLPTSSEWEKAAVLGTPYPPGDFITIVTRKSSVPIKIAVPGVLGVTGMIGNVWEWCSDWYSSDLRKKDAKPLTPGSTIDREKVIRGGSWASTESSRRIQNIHKASPRGYFRTVGFRVVKEQ